MGTKATQDIQGLPPTKEARAFDALVQAFRNDPGIKDHINTFVHCEGVDRDFFQPAYNLCPYLEIAPWPTESDWITEGQHFMPLSLRIMCAVQGTKFSNIANWWGVIRTAFFTPATQLLLTGGSIGDLVTKPTIKLNAYGATKDDQGLRMMIADGTVQLGLLIST